MERKRLLLAEPDSPPFPVLVKLREAEERARHAFAAMEGKRQEQAKQFTDNLAGVESEEMVRIEALELALRDQGHSLKEAVEAGHRINRRRSDEIHTEVESLESRLRATIADAQEDELARVGSLLRQAQEQVNACLTIGAVLRSSIRHSLPEIMVDDTHDSHIFANTLFLGQSGGSSSPASHRQGRNGDRCE